MADLGTYYVQISASTGGMGKAIAKDLDGANIGDVEGKKLGSGLLASIKDVAIGSALGNMISNGIGKAMEGAKQLFSEAFQGYADFQQNVGGVQKLYGNMGKSLEDYAKSVGKSTTEVAGEWQSLENAQTTVLKNAQSAYKTTGMSANTYMENATSFSAALINSLGGDTEAAAAQTQVAMAAISDNWNTFGGDLNMVTQAYQGFAKQNYTMLDNLKLGYGGTKTEMERLIADANAWGAANGRASDLSIDSFSDVVTAIQYIQESQNIAGTTAREATETISGSLNMLSSAWENFLTDLGNKEGDMSARVSEVVESLSAVAANVAPMVIQMGAAAIQAIPQLISSAMQAIAATLVPMIDEVTGGAASRFMEGFGQIRESLAPVGEAFATIFGKAQEWVGRLAPSIGALASGAMSLMQAAAQNIGRAFEVMTPLISVAADGFGNVLSGAIQIVAGLFEGLAKILKGIGDFMAPLVEAMVGGFEKIAETAGPIINGLGGMIGGIGDFFADPIKAIGDFVTGGSKDMNNFAKNTKKANDTVAKSTKSTFQQVAKTVSESTSTVKTTTTKSFQDMATTVGLQTTKQEKALRDAYTNMQRAAKTGNEAIYQDAKNRFEAVKSAVDTSMKQASSSVSTNTTTMKNDSSNNLTTMSSTVGTKMNEVYSKVKKSMEDSVTKTTNSVQSMQSSVNSFKGKTVDVGVKNVIGNAVKNAQNTVNSFKGKTVDLATKLGNGFADTIRKAKEYIGGVNGKTVDITLNVKKTGVREISVEQSYSSTGIPKYNVRTLMAQGGFLLGPTNVLAGEAGTEAIVPLSNTKYARPFAQAVAAEIDRGGGGITINVREMNVRKESDIRAVASQLNALVSRANGGRL